MTMADGLPGSLLLDDLQSKIKVLHDTVWERRASWPLVQRWSQQFSSGTSSLDINSLHALYLLSHFMYFGLSEIRALLKSLHRDVHRPAVISSLRLRHPSASSERLLEMCAQELEATRYVSLGNPSESSALILYYFRQENRLRKSQFITGSDIFDLTQVAAGGAVKLRDPHVNHYIFIDDLCGSGTQGQEYSDNIVTPLKALKPTAAVYYYTLFGLVDGIDHIKELKRFDNVHAVVELDDTFKCFSLYSRIFSGCPALINQTHAHQLMLSFGSSLWPNHPLGYENGQLLLGFAHNTPDNTLPTIWADGRDGAPWTPVFKRYHKQQ
ncbi:MAG: phosphoribosyltransferase-like protein [Caulobacteraceae bacterium]